MYRKTLIAAALLAVIAGAAVAAPQTSNNSDTSQRTHARVTLDANRDGVIDRAEAAKLPRLAAVFDKLDANKDGRLEASERPQRKHHRQRRGMHGMRGGIERLDKDADGRISRAEFDAGTAARAERMQKSGIQPNQGRKPHVLDFAAVDGNKDGYLVRTELRAYNDRMRPQREALFAKRSAERFSAADINKDGKLSKLEVGEKMPRLERSFAWMDDNRDGFLNQQELQPQRRR